MAIILDGKLLAEEIKQEVRKDVEELNKRNIYPKLAVIMVGEDEASKIYVRNKTKACRDTKIEYEEYLLDKTTNIDVVLKLIQDLNKRDDIHGILLQSPVPKQIDIYEAFKTIDYRKDVDGFSPINVGRLMLNRTTFIPCTAKGIMALLKKYKIKVKGANVVIIGRSNIVGKPLAQYMLNEDATVTICHSQTKNLEEITKNADILVSAVGKPNFVTENMVKENAVVIDVGISKDDDRITGDVDFENVSKKAGYISPVPGGVGPMTIAMLMHNVVIAAKYLEEK